jgi:hypothetical protein
MEPTNEELQEALTTMESKTDQMIETFGGMEKQMSLVIQLAERKEKKTGDVLPSFLTLITNRLKTRFPHAIWLVPIVLLAGAELDVRDIFFDAPVVMSEETQTAVDILHVIEQGVKNDTGILFYPNNEKIAWKEVEVKSFAPGEIEIKPEIESFDDAGAIESEE